jgi:O-antigen/teichoic acid export membrane protein
MNINDLKSNFRFRHYSRNMLFKNSVYIMLTNLSNAGFGFVFWILAAKVYSTEDVGIATAILSSIGIIILLSRLGMDFSIIRFFPINSSNGVFNTSAVITTFCALIFGAIFILGIDIFSPELHFLKSPLNTIFFMIIVAANSLTTITGVSFIAFRKPVYYFIQSLLVGSRVLFLIPFIALGVSGIFCAVGSSFIIAIFATLIFLMKLDIKLSFDIDRYYLKEAFNYSVGNYLTSLFITGPSLICPVMILNILGAEQGAYYYIVYAIASLLFMIPNAIGTSLFVEGSYGEDLKKNIVKSLLFSVSFQIPVSTTLYLLSDWLLSIVGPNYVGGTELLKLMILSSFFVGFNSIYFTIKRIQKDTKRLVIQNGLIFALLIGLGYVFTLRFGLIGMGYAWILSYAISLVVIGIDISGKIF